MMQDTEAAREKLLKAADQIDMLETNAEATKVSVDAMKAQIAQLQDANTTLKQQIAALQATLDKSEADRAKERQVLLDEVAKLVASNKSSSKGNPAKKEKESTASSSTKETPSSADTMETTKSTSGTASTDADTPPPKPQKGYYHVVAPGETITLICTAYREQGIKVTVGEIQRANGLTDKSILKVGQKLFVPKPD